MPRRPHDGLPLLGIDAQEHVHAQHPALHARVEPHGVAATMPSVPGASSARPPSCAPRRGAGEGAVLRRASSRRRRGGGGRCRPLCSSSAYCRQCITDDTKPSIMWVIPTGVPATVAPLIQGAGHAQVESVLAGAGKTGRRSWRSSPSRATTRSRRRAGRERLPRFKREGLARTPCSLGETGELVPVPRADAVIPLPVTT